jgi:hypothetical protein
VPDGGGAHIAPRTASDAFSEAIDHARCEIGLTDDRAPEYLAGAINLRQLSKGLPPLGDTPAMTVIGFNDAFARRYSDILDVVNAAKELAEIDAEDGR